MELIRLIDEQIYLRMRKFLTLRFIRLFRSSGSPEIFAEMKRSEERPPSRLRAWEIFHPEGD